MDPQARNSYPYWTEVSHNGSIPIEPGTAILDVLPLNSVPPSHPVRSAPSPPKKANASASASATDIISGPPVAGTPAMIFFTSHPSAEEWNSVVAATKKGVALTGSAAKGKAGPAIGSVDIAQSDDEYLFRVSLPGVIRDANVFACDVQPDGGITVRGKTMTGGQKVRKDNMVFKMQTQNLSPPGEFSVSFRLPGPIDQHHQIQGVFGTDGIFEAIVRKKAPTKRG